MTPSLDMTTTRACLLTAALALAASCSKAVPVEVRIVKDLCGQTPSPVQDVTHLRLRVVAEDGSTLLERVDELSLGRDQMEEIPAGRMLRLQATGFAGAPPAGRIVSYGSSQPFQVPDQLVEGQQLIQVNVFLRQVERFSPVVPAADPANRCTQLSVARAGHTATLLDDGRVLIAGGFEGEAPGEVDWQYKESVEIFDPATGDVTTSSPPMQFNGRATPRAFHTATRLPNGQVLVAGGELSITVNSARSMTTRADAIVFDATVEQGNGAWVAANSAMKSKRSRHGAVMDKNGRVLFVGGTAWSAGSPATTSVIDLVEWFDPDLYNFKEMTGTTVKRAGHTTLAVLQDTVVAIAGGNDGIQQVSSDSVHFFPSNSSGFSSLPQGLSVRVGRSGVASARLADGLFVVLGGFTGLDQSRPEGPYLGTDVVRVSGQPARGDGPNLDLARGFICAVTLPDGRALAIGGRGRVGVGGAQESLSATDVLSESGGQVEAARADSLAEPRYHHTCTVLLDGTVLVAGGVRETSDGFSASRSLEIFTPRPAD